MQEGTAKNTGKLFFQATAGNQLEQSQLSNEIRELENKVENVNQLLHRHSLGTTVRFQLREDLQYHQQQIEWKRTRLQQLSGGMA
ncbi:MAG: hypothetical protein H7Z75_16330 [Ferruginibacter sp.]|nr:hypothetical protein [Cytophagales bacterium]